MATATRQTTTARTTSSAVTAAIGTQPESTGPATEVTSELIHLDPRTLLLQGNIRRRAELDEDFVASIRDHGVLVPIVAVRTDQGVQVRYGQRRTLAAIETHRSTVPVMVLSGEPGAELDRIIEQWHENEQRTGLSVAGASIIRFGPVPAFV